mmetsp:Transcript_18285/g.29160  ORF Transcript_18285/g.29160 Transcript_18285/m.29160 type:complete len:85 (+) Transcript_18285:1071-1325(+)
MNIERETILQSSCTAGKHREYRSSERSGGGRGMVFESIRFIVKRPVIIPNSPLLTLILSITNQTSFLMIYQRVGITSRGYYLSK